MHLDLLLQFHEKKCLKFGSGQALARPLQTSRTRTHGLGIGNNMEEIRRLVAERLAAETLLVALLSRFDDHDASTRATINDAFDHATRFLEDRTFDASESAGLEELAHSLRVIEELRVATLGPREESKQENSLGAQPSCDSDCDESLTR
jgi:hypothetical protein